MKLKLVAILFLLFISCSDDDPLIADAELEGEWTLSDVICYCGFESDIDFSLTKISFNPNRNSVTVINESEYVFFRDTGEHTYGGQANRINFSDGSVYFFEIRGELLTLTFEDNVDIADDEVTYIFTR
ncbi:hypothetical protein CLV90_3059 [Maribacter spongiicola]|uniref:Lipocalin-like protein n=1 Tax=Maribacter spongiicola TaxID=1206753 RepID=A0A4V3EQM9_9FLAO|nr:hypothetical protein [Maribacter spongiicola]TDT41828.1 hypothetical protein CLV90_3059 [Maribacter spongiicola]